MLSPRPIATAEARAVAASLGTRAERVLRAGETARRAGFGAEVTFTAAGADPAVAGKGAIRRSYRRLPNPSQQLLRPFDLQRYDGAPGATKSLVTAVITSGLGTPPPSRSPDEQIKRLREKGVLATARA